MTQVEVNNPPASLSLEAQLWEAVKESDETKVRELLAQGAKAKFEKHDPGVWGSSHRQSIIHVALLNQPINKPIVQLLLEAGADPNAEYEDYNWKGSGSSQSSSSVSTMRYDGSESWSPIHVVARQRYFPALKLLLEHGAEVDAIATKEGQSEYGHGCNTVETSLHIICSFDPRHQEQSEDNYNCAKILLEHGANPNAIRKRLDLLTVREEDLASPRNPRSPDYVNPYSQIRVEETPLQIALQHNNTRLALLLLQHGAENSIPWIYGSHKVPTIKLMPSDMMSSFWNLPAHQYFPKEVQKKVETVFLCSKRLKWNIPKEILCEIIKLSLSGAKNDWTMEDFINLQKAVCREEKNRRRKTKPPTAKYDSNEPASKPRLKSKRCVIS